MAAKIKFKSFTNKKKKLSIFFKVHFTTTTTKLNFSCHTQKSQQQQQKHGGKIRN